MSDPARQRLCHALALAILVLGHGGLILGLALMGEWRVWRFITNLIAQVDAGLLIGWMVWTSVRSIPRSAVLKMLERLIGLPMAAPETPKMRQFRLIFIALASATTVGISALGMLIHLVGRVGAGGALAALIAATLLVGLVFFTAKSRRDDRWILERGFEREGGGV
jgi:hypothetical protein